MKTRTQRKYLDRMPPEIVRAVLSCVRPADALPLARCAALALRAYLSNGLWKQWPRGTLGLGAGHWPRARWLRTATARVDSANRTGRGRLGPPLERTSPRTVLAVSGQWRNV